MAEIDVIVFYWSLCPSEHMNALFEIITPPPIDRMRKFGVEQCQIQHDVKTHDITGERLGNATAKAGDIAYQ